MKTSIIIEKKILRMAYRIGSFSLFICLLLRSFLFSFFFFYIVFFFPSFVSRVIGWERESILTNQRSGKQQAFLSLRCEVRERERKIKERKKERKKERRYRKKEKKERTQNRKIGRQK